MKGLVIKSTGSWYDVLDENRQVVKCRLRGIFKLAGKKVTNPIAVGDQVIMEEDKGNDSAKVIVDILQRKNEIIRKSTRKKRFSHVIAANVDQAVLLVTLVYPRTSFGFIDRFLVAAESYQIPSILVFNKMDLYDDDILTELDVVRDGYEKCGYKTEVISAQTKTNLDRIDHLLKDKVSLMAGHSGVGKSTLINLLSDDADQTTAEVSSAVQKGVHTTTFAEMFLLRNGGYIIDTPGIKEFGLVDIDDKELHHFFPEMRDLFGKCKYYNCTHNHEPDCAIVKALNNNEIMSSRYISYLSMMDDDDNRR